MIRFTLAGERMEIKVWRLAVWLTWFSFACLCFDVFVWNTWVDLPVELAYGAFIEWVFPTFGLYPVIGSAIRDLRDIRRLRAERKAGR